MQNGKLSGISLSTLILKKMETIIWDYISSMDTNSVTTEINLTDWLSAEAKKKKKKKQLALYYRKLTL